MSAHPDAWTVEWPQQVPALAYSLDADAEPETVLWVAPARPVNRLLTPAPRVRAPEPHDWDDVVAHAIVLLLCLVSVAVIVGLMGMAMELRQ